ncbi:MAG: DUF1572 family protein [Phycisphaerales bacterium]|nr:DUF1572 family protein [Phycisphaerales bacterium]MCB9836108.1 DUF1572 family protein [Phycisphaera sp.]
MDTPSHDNQIIQGWLTAFASSKKWADGSIEQMSDEQLFTRVAPGFNSVAAIMKHIAGNVKSRWTDWRTTDGEKPWRNRETEFDVEGLSRDDVQKLWDNAWVTIYRELMSMTEEDLGRTITIRGEDHTVPEAVSRQLLHMGYHTGQIVWLGRMLVGDGWKWLTVKPGGSDDFNRLMHDRFGPGLGPGMGQA